jgi:hypothetical protein
MALRRSIFPGGGLVVIFVERECSISFFNCNLEQTGPDPLLQFWSKIIAIHGLNSTQKWQFAFLGMTMVPTWSMVLTAMAVNFWATIFMSKEGAATKSQQEIDAILALLQSCTPDVLALLKRRTTTYTSENGGFRDILRAVTSMHLDSEQSQDHVVVANLILDCVARPASKFLGKRKSADDPTSAPMTQSAQNQETKP